MKPNYNSNIPTVDGDADGAPDAVPTTLGGLPYEPVAASQTDQVLGGAGAVGDTLSHLVVFPATTAPGTVVIKDNTTVIGTFPGGASSVSNLVPFTIPVGVASKNGAFKITTGADVSVIAVGRFT